MKQKSLFSYRTNSAVLSGWKQRLSSSFQGRRSSLDSVSNETNLPLSVRYLMHRVQAPTKTYMIPSIKLQMRQSKSYTLQMNTVLEDIDNEIFATKSAPDLNNNDL